ncbi:MAG: FG-GAP repeat protein, partial [Xanthomonadales bacterium]|nr:FG-GAP repeat protein [Xanthomonadales bacterium]
QAYLKASNADNGDWFGWSVAVAGDTVVVGAVGEDSSSTGVDSTPNESASGAGAAYVFARSGVIWSQQAYLKASNADYGDRFGSSVAASGDTIVLGARLEDSSTTVVDSTPNNSADDAGAAYVFTIRSQALFSDSFE